MFETNFYQDLIDKYFNNIKPPITHQEIAKIGGPISWYLADSNNNIINMTGNNTNYILDLDIKSAFPTICHNLFNQNSPFITHLDSIQEKLEKNIFIATTLKGERLKQINQICKLIIVGIIFDTQDQNELDDITILELKKDGCLITCNYDTLQRIKNLNNSDQDFTKYIKLLNFDFHYDEYTKYIRSNRTTFLLNKGLDNLKIKGQYKYIPEKLKLSMINIMLNNFVDMKNIKLIYTTEFFKIIQKNNLSTYLKNYYLCNKNKVINHIGKYTNIQYNTKVDPQLYKKLFLYPLLIE